MDTNHADARRTAEMNAEDDRDTTADGPFALLPEESDRSLGRRRQRASSSAEGTAEALQLLRIEDVCRLLRISQPTLWRMRRARCFPEPTEVTGRIVAWSRAEVQEWIAGRRRSNSPIVTTRRGG